MKINRLITLLLLAASSVSFASVEQATTAEPIVVAWWGHAVVSEAQKDSAINSRRIYETPEKTTERQLRQLSVNTPQELEMTAREIVTFSVNDKKVSDTLAEILVQRSTQGDVNFSQALAWSSRALGSLGSDRYRTILQQVAKTAADKRIRKHAQASLKRLPKGMNSEQYQAGTIKVKLSVF